MLNKMRQSLCTYMILGLFLSIFQTASVRAGELAITGLDIAALTGDRLQIQLEMNGAAIEPKVFHTDNPARIALDFSGVKNGLDKKMFPINRGAASTIYVAEAADRVRVVVNLIESTPFETKVVGNKVLLTLTRASIKAPAKLKPFAEKPGAPVAVKSANSVARALIPEQTISGFDFKRGDKGEGRILVSLANPDTIVNSKQEGGKVVINLLNTRLPENLAKRLDVSEFATPIKFIDTVSSNQETTVTVTTQNDLYDYSLFQSEGLLTIEFRPLSFAEKEALERTRVKYKGDRLSLNFQDIEIRSVIAILAEFTGQNIVAGDDVTGAITLKLDDVPWDEALDFIMMTKNLGKYETGNVTLISPLDKIKDYKQKQQETAAVVEQLDPLVTEYIKINYARAENFRNLLNGLDTGQFGSCGSKSSSGSSTSSSSSLGSLTTQGGQGGYQSVNQGSSQGNTQGNTQGGQNDAFKILSSRGSAVVDARTNTLIVRETTKRLEEAKKLIRKLDVPVRQVMIESRIVIASNTFAKTLGVRFGVAGKNVHVNNGSGPVGSVNNLGGTTGTINGTAIINDALVDLAASNPYGALGMTLARGADYVLNLELSALQDQGRGEIVSNPRVMTTDRCTAKIIQGTQIPYQSGAAVGTPANIQFVDALLELDVLPQITPSGSISMTLNITKDEPNPVTLGQQPPITKRQVETTVQVMDGETVVLGGVFEGTQQNTTNAVPFLADLPGIGFLFKRTVNQNDKKELLIFVTPKIITDNAASN
ncbi:MAG: type IV pilus secretin PilQ [Methylococcaceae bacterium]|nr:type IV pilus secretin PilQ [Methylococcaceae bacterium]